MKSATTHEFDPDIAGLEPNRCRELDCGLGESAAIHQPESPQGEDSKESALVIGAIPLHALSRTVTIKQGLLDNFVIAAAPFVDCVRVGRYEKRDCTEMKSDQRWEGITCTGCTLRAAIGKLYDELATRPVAAAEITRLREVLKGFANCRIIHGSYPTGTTCLDVQDFARVNKPPHRFVTEYRDAILAGEHLCDGCKARAAIAGEQEEREG